MIPKMLFLTVFILNSCASQKLNPTLKTSDWEVILIDGKKILSNHPTISFIEKGRQIGGYGGCNYFGGRYEVNGENISFSKMTSTLMACIGDDLEDRFFSALDKVKKYRVKEDKLQFLDERKTVVMLLKVVVNKD